MPIHVRYGVHLLRLFVPVVGPRGAPVAQDFDIGSLTSFALTLLQSELAPVRTSARLQTVDSIGGLNLWESRVSN